MCDEDHPNRRVLAEIVGAAFREELIAIAFSIVHDDSVAEGVVHDVILAAGAEGSRLAAADDPRAYLRVSVRRRGWKREADRRQDASRSTELDETSVSNRAPSAHEGYFIDEEVPAALPRRLRPIYELRRKGMTVEEVAEELGLSLSTVKRGLREIKAILRELLGGEWKI